MKTGNRLHGTAEIIKAIFLGTGIGLLVIFVTGIAFAFLIRGAFLPEEWENGISVVICAMGIIPGCMIAQKLAGRARLPVSLACAILFVAVLRLVRTAAHFGSAPRWYIALIPVVCAVLCAFFGAGRGR